MQTTAQSDKQLWKVGAAQKKSSGTSTIHLIIQFHTRPSYRVAAAVGSNRRGPWVGKSPPLGDTEGTDTLESSSNWRCLTVLFSMLQKIAHAIWSSLIHYLFQAVNSTCSFMALTSAAAWNPGRSQPRGPSAGRQPQPTPRRQCSVSEGGGRCTWSLAAGRRWRGPVWWGETQSWAAPRSHHAPVAMHGVNTASRRNHWEERRKQKQLKVRHAVLV